MSFCRHIPPPHGDDLGVISFPWGHRTHTIRKMNWINGLQAHTAKEGRGETTPDPLIALYDALWDAQVPSVARLGAALGD